MEVTKRDRPEPKRLSYDNLAGIASGAIEVDTGAGASGNDNEKGTEGGTATPLHLPPGTSPALLKDAPNTRVRRPRGRRRSFSSGENLSMLVAPSTTKSQEVKSKRKASSASDNGRVRVALRLRPFIAEDWNLAKSLEEAAASKKGGSPYTSKAQDPAALLVRPEHSYLQVNPDEGCVRVQRHISETPRQYFYENVFGPNSEQKNVYAEVGQPVVQDVLKGYHGTLLCYGQTGTGKTYTLMNGFDGASVRPNERGLIAHSIDELFDAIQNDDSQFQYTVGFSYIQLYCEKISDLLNPEGENLPIREDPGSGVFVPGLTVKTVKDSAECLKYWEVGNKHRATAATNMNEASSRSHAIVCLYVERISRTLNFGAVHDPNDDLVATPKKRRARAGTVATKQTRISSKLTFVDLAGSERQGKTGSKGTSFTEAKAINLSLSSLGKVIHALSDKSNTHIPYRDSKLTRLLQDSLGGNAQTSLIVTIGPSFANLQESISSLQFGSRARKVVTYAKINEEVDFEILSRQQEKQLEAQALELANRDEEVHQLQDVLLKLQMEVVRLGGDASVLTDAPAGKFIPAARRTASGSFEVAASPDGSVRMSTPGAAARTDSAGYETPASQAGSAIDPEVEEILNNEIDTLKKGAKEAESKIESATKQRDSARKQRDMNMKLVQNKTMEIKSLKSANISLEEQLNNTNQMLTTRTNDLTEIRQDLEARLDEIATLKENVKEVDVIREQLSSAMSSLLIAQQTFQTEQAQKDVRIAELEEQLGTGGGGGGGEKGLNMSEALANAEKDRDDALDAKARAEKQVADLNFQLEEVQFNLDSTKDALSSQETSTRVKITNIRAATAKQVEELEHKLKTASEEASSAATEKRAAVAKMRKARTELTELKSALKDNTEMHKADLARANDISESTISRLKLQLTEAQSSLDKARRAKRALSGEREAVRAGQSAATAELNAKLKKAEAELFKAQERATSLQHEKQLLIASKGTAEQVDKYKRRVQELENEKSLLSTELAGFVESAQSSAMQLHADLQSSKQQVVTLTNSKDSLEVELRETKHDLRSKLKQSSEDNIRLRSINSETSTAINDLVTEMQTSALDLHQQLAVAHAALAERERELERVTQLHNSCEDPEQVGAMKTELDDVIKARVSLQNENKALREAMARMEKEVESLQGDMHRLGTELETAQTTLKAQIEAAETEREKSRETVEKETGDLKDSLETTQQANDTLEKSVTTLTAEKDRLTDLLNAAEARVDMYNDVIPVQEYETKLGEHEQEKQRLELDFHRQEMGFINEVGKLKEDITRLEHVKSSLQAEADRVPGLMTKVEQLTERVQRLQNGEAIGALEARIADLENALELASQAEAAHNQTITALSAKTEAVEELAHERLVNYERCVDEADALRDTISVQAKAMAMVPMKDILIEELKEKLDTQDQEISILVDEKEAQDDEIRELNNLCRSVTEMNIKSSQPVSPARPRKRGYDVEFAHAMLDKVISGLERNAEETVAQEESANMELMLAYLTKKADAVERHVTHRLIPELRAARADVARTAWNDSNWATVRNIAARPDDDPGNEPSRVSVDTDRGDVRTSDPSVVNSVHSIGNASDDNDGGDGMGVGQGSREVASRATGPVKTRLSIDDPRALLSADGSRTRLIGDDPHPMADEEEPVPGRTPLPVEVSALDYPERRESSDSMGLNISPAPLSFKHTESLVSGSPRVGRHANGPGASPLGGTIPSGDDDDIDAGVSSGLLNQDLFGSGRKRVGSGGDSFQSKPLPPNIFQSTAASTRSLYMSQLLTPVPESDSDNDHDLDTTDSTPRDTADDGIYMSQLMTPVPVSDDEGDTHLGAQLSESLSTSPQHDVIAGIHDEPLEYPYE